MRIEFDPTNPTEAAAVRAMLTAMAAPETPWIAKRYVMTATGDADAGEPTPVDPVAMTEVGERIAEARAYATAPSTDSQGEPHDSRIHSTPATTNKDGTWRAKRGVTADQIAAVRAERDAPPVALAEETVEEVATLTATDGAGMTVTENPETGERTVSVEAEQFVVTAPPAPPVTTAPPAPITTGSPSFLDVMKAITAAQKDGKIDTAKVKELCAAVGAGESTMGLNGPDNGDKRVAFMALLASEVAA